MRVSVLIPTYRRPDNLIQVLTALAAQTRPADEIVLAVRQTDTATRDFLKTDPVAQSLPIVVADAPETGGVVAAMNAGVQTVTGDIMALTDDDTKPHADWLEKIERTFASDHRIGAVGGLDAQPQVPVHDSPIVGVLQWFGRTIGNHHIGMGPARDVDFVKGANCAYRTAPLKAIGFDTRLWGKGAQVHFEQVAGLALRRAGWRIIYDPAIVLDHFPAVRFDYDQRGQFNRQAMLDQSHNATLSIYEHLAAPQRLVFVLWSVGVGTAAEPGLLQGVRFLLKDRNALAKVAPTIQGRFAGIRTAQKSRRPEAPAPTSPEVPESASTKAESAW